MWVGYHWGGVLGTALGAGTGSQTIEARHAQWEAGSISHFVSKRFLFFIPSARPGPVQDQLGLFNFIFNLDVNLNLGKGGLSRPGQAMAGPGRP